MRWGWISMIAVAFATAGSADVTTLTPARDNTLFEDAEGDTSSGLGPALFAGRNGEGRARRALLAFELAGQVPAGARIDRVTLVFRVSNAPDAVPRPFTLHRVLDAWGEGGSSSSGGAGAPAVAGDATWRHRFYPADPWSLPGGDFDPQPRAARFLAGVGDYAWTDAELARDVEAWLARSETNHGWILVGDESVLRSARRIDSREAADPSARPALTIEYTVPTTYRGVTWGSVKARYRRGEP